MGWVHCLEEMLNRVRVSRNGSVIGHGIVSVWVALALVSTAIAQSTPPAARLKTDDVARGLFQAGKAAFDAGNFDEALQYFEQSYARSGRPQLQYNIGVTADRLRQDERALTAFRAYLGQVADAENRAEVESRIRALEKARTEREASIPAPTPEQTAHEASVDKTRSDVALTQVEPGDSASGGKPLTKQWWFWTGIGAVVVGTLITAIAVSSGSDEQSPPIESRSGITIMTLRAR